VAPWPEEEKEAWVVLPSPGLSRPHLACLRSRPPSPPSSPPKNPTATNQQNSYICEFTLKYFRKKATLLRHLAKLPARHPPGDEIYRSPPPPPGASGSAAFAGSNAVASPPIAVFEVDGKRHKTYCQNLCLLSKLFLDHKTLYYDVDPFLFYVLCEVDADGYHTVGYFSKEKNWQNQEGSYNLACILTLPAYQRKGYGRFLIALAYQLSRLEGRAGTAERPLSDLGAVSFRSYWQKAVLDVLREARGDVSVQDISDRTMMTTGDVTDTLRRLGLLNYWKGSHYISASARVVEEYCRQVAGGQRVLEVDPRFLHWQPLTAGPVVGKK
jgi:histone acetyltransferase MYST1